MKTILGYSLRVIGIILVLYSIGFSLFWFGIFWYYAEFSGTSSNLWFTLPETSYQYLILFVLSHILWLFTGATLTQIGTHLID